LNRRVIADSLQDMKTSAASLVLAGFALLVATACHQSTLTDEIGT